MIRMSLIINKGGRSTAAENFSIGSVRAADISRGKHP
jgi:hypothetical protein